jgi:hypothetical protein
MTLDKKTIKEIESAFKKFQVLTIHLEDKEFQMLPLGELPQKKMREFVEKDDKQKMAMMVELIGTCSINPTKTMQEIQELTMTEMQEFIAQWVLESQ